MKSLKHLETGWVGWLWSLFPLRLCNTWWWIVLIQTSAVVRLWAWYRKVRWQSSSCLSTSSTCRRMARMDVGGWKKQDDELFTTPLFYNMVLIFAWACQLIVRNSLWHPWVYPQNSQFKIHWREFLLGYRPTESVECKFPYSDGSRTLLPNSVGFIDGQLKVLCVCSILAMITALDTLTQICTCLFWLNWGK